MPVTKRDGQTGHGVTLGYDAAGGESFTMLPCLTKLSELDEGEPEAIDAGHLCDTDMVKRITLGEVDPGTLEAEAIFKHEDFAAVAALWCSETVNWQLSVPNPAGGAPFTRTFPGILMKKPIGPFERGALVLMKFSIKINGPVT